MKKTILSATAVAVLAGLTFGLTAEGQNTREPRSPAGHKIGMIDMAYVFKNYKKFEAMREALKAEIEQSDQEARRLYNEIQTLSQEIKKIRESGKFKDGSPELKRRQDQLIELDAKHKSFRQKAQLEFLEKEANIYKTVYLEVSEAVRQYAEYYGYTAILRYSRETVKDANDPREVLQKMNRLVVYLKPNEDITDSVLNFLNDRYEGPASRSAAGGRDNTRRQ